MAHLLMIYHVIVAIYRRTQEVTGLIVKDGCLRSFVMVLNLYYFLFIWIAFYWVYFIKTTNYIRFLRKFHRIPMRCFPNPMTKHQILVSPPQQIIFIFGFS